MTSSSDGEPLKRRVLVRNLPPLVSAIQPGDNQPGGANKISKADIRRWFSAYGPIACVHLSSSNGGYSDARDGCGRRHAFVTFEDESCALACAAAFASLSPGENGCQDNANLRENEESSYDMPPPGISVVMDRYRDGGGHWPTLPIHPIRRENFSRPFGGRSFGGSAFGGINAHTHINHLIQPRVSNNASSGNNSSSSNRNSYHLNRGTPTNSASPSHRIVHHIENGMGVDEKSKVINARHDYICDTDKVRLRDGNNGSLLFELLNIERYPHIVEHIFCHLNAASLRKCRTLCRKLKDTVDNFILGNPCIAKDLSIRWKEGKCSFYPVFPTSDLADEHNPESKYRNVLAMKADASEIVIALDNGNVEVYDRESLSLTFTIVGKFSVSPTVLDISDDYILVGYTASTFGKHRMTSSGGGSRGRVRQIASGSHMQKGRKGPALPQNSWWKIFCRRTKQHLRTIEKSHVTRLYALSAAQQKANFEIKDATKDTEIYTEPNSNCSGSCDPKSLSNNSKNEDTSVYDYSYSEARLGPSNLIYFHSRLSILNVDCNIQVNSNSKTNDLESDMFDKNLAQNKERNGETVLDDTNDSSNFSTSFNSPINIARIATISDMNNAVIREFDVDLNLIVVGVKKMDLETSIDKPCSSNYLLVFKNHEKIKKFHEDKGEKKDASPAPDIYTSDDEDEDHKTHQRRPIAQKHQVLLHPDNVLRPVLKIPLLCRYTPPGKDSDFDDTRCFIDTVQVMYPLCLVQLSNNGGSFEHVSSLGQPYVCMAFVDIEKGSCLKIITFDQGWMRHNLKKFGETNFVPYDSDTSILVSKISCTHFVVGFGSFSSRNDGCLGIWELSDLLKIDDDVDEHQETKTLCSDIKSNVSVTDGGIWNFDTPVYLLDRPTFHWSGWDDHCGGVGHIEIDK